VSLSADESSIGTGTLVPPDRAVENNEMAVLLEPADVLTTRPVVELRRLIARR